MARWTYLLPIRQSTIVDVIWENLNPSEALIEHYQANCWDETSHKENMKPFEIYPVKLWNGQRLSLL